MHNTEMTVKVTIVSQHHMDEQDLALELLHMELGYNNLGRERVHLEEPRVAEGKE